MRLAAVLLTLALALAGPAPAVAQNSSDQQLETQIGQQEYQQLQQKGEIVANSPYYSVLNPIAQQIKRVADPQYYHPFQFIIVHESSPNAFAVPGGNVYVTDSLMKFVENREELAGVLCHETSHDIHHDVLNLYKKQQKTATAYTIGDVLANVLTGGKYSGAIDTVAQYGFTFQTLHFSRDVEAAADHKGAQTCAEAGSNPWGMVWLFQHFEKLNTSSPPEFMSDHPTDQDRIAALESEFRSDPQLFGRYPSSIAYAHPLSAGVTQATAAASTASYKKVAKKSKGMFPPGSGYKY
ncbi:MAG TPA: M48 family metallopeptidase [Candidatus Elarobacter sp.]|jgi:predicted Zn-dependent protease